VIDPDRQAANRLVDLVAASARAPAIVEAIDDLPRDVEVAAICAPSGIHVDLAAACIAAGKHTLVEKPLDVRLSRARDLLAADARARAAGLTVSVVSQHRFDPASVRARELIAAGELGRVAGASSTLSWWRSQGYYDSAEWRGSWALDGGGVVMNQGIHSVDLLVWLLGRPVEVVAATGLLAHKRIEVEDTAAVIVTFDSGAIATFHATTAAYPGLGTRLVVTGDRGSLSIWNDEMEYLHVRGAAASEAGGMGGGANQIEVSKSPSGADATTSQIGHTRQYRDFCRAIRSRTPAGVTVEDAVLSLATVQAIYAAAASGRRVAVSDVLRGDYDDIHPVYGEP
jgi:predicted dehydrogenase